jgi:hypothetical protein
VDAFQPSTTLCTGLSQGATCDNDPADHCSGNSTACVDAFQPSTTLCTGSSQGAVCDDDGADHCSGTSTACVDAFQPSTTLCTGTSQGGACDDDAADHCSGGNSLCLDVYEPSTTECRASGAVCDPAEMCTGSSGSCPADVVNGSQPVGNTVLLSHDQQSGTTTVAWTEVDPGPFNVYRGARIGSQPWVFNQGCFASGVGASPVTDSDNPPAGKMYFYLVSRDEPVCTESSLGLQSNASERPNTSACPNPGNDADGDSVLDAADNCPSTANTTQDDVDSDLIGDACDNCPLVPNTDQTDTDNDNIGDACE